MELQQSKTNKYDQKPRISQRRLKMSGKVEVMKPKIHRYKLLTPITPMENRSRLDNGGIDQAPRTKLDLIALIGRINALQKAT